MLKSAHRSLFFFALLLALSSAACDDDGGSSPDDAMTSTMDGAGDAATTGDTTTTGDAGDSTSTGDVGEDVDAIVLPSCAEPGPASIMRTAFGTAYAIDGCGRLFTWGRQHPLYDAAVDASIRPTPVQIGDARWRDIVATDAHLCGIQFDGTLWCWGQNTGALGFELAMFEHPEPVRVGELDDWRMLTAEFSGLVPAMTCGVRGEGELWCWGGNISRFYDALDDTLPDTLPTPTRVGDDLWSHAVMEFGLFCGVKTNGELWCFGNDNLGQLGQGTPSPQPGWQPLVQVPGEWRWVDIHQAGVCAINTDDALWCWGDMNWLDSFAEGTGPHASPLLIGEGLAFATVSFGFWHVAGLLRDGRLAELTRSYDGALVIDDGLGARWTDVSIIDGAREQPFGGVCVASDNGEVWCRGGNARAELGQGTWATRWSPTQVGVTADYRDVILHGFGACAIQAGDVLCWGQPGVFSPPDPTGHLIPESIAAPESMVKLAFDAVANLCALSEAGNLWCRGSSNPFNNLGVGSAEFEPGVWHRVGDASGWTDIDMPVHDTCGIRDGSLYCWGSFGPGSIDTPHDPVNTDWVEVALPPYFVFGMVGCGLRDGGSVWCVDTNGDATQVGTATELRELVMRSDSGELLLCGMTAAGVEMCAPADGSADFAEVSATAWLEVIYAANKICGVHADGTLACDATDGPLQGTGDPAGSATSNLDDTDWFSVAFNGQTVCGLKGAAPAGELWCWGEGVSGTTGNGESYHHDWLRVPDIGL